MAPFKRKLNSIISGVKEDFCDYFRRFEAVENVRYERFAEIWRDMKLSIIWSGRQTEHEAREFMEECLRVAVAYWMPPCSFQTQVGALYLLYGLYSTQPCMPKVRIRILPSEWTEVIKFRDRLKAEQHYDAEYVYWKLVLEKAFYFVAIPIDVNLRHKETQNIEAQNETHAPASSSTSLVDPTHLECLTAFHDKYHKFKCQLAGPDATRPDTSLDFIHSDLLASIHSLIQKHKEASFSGRRVRAPTAYGDGDKMEEENEHDADAGMTGGMKGKRSKIGKARVKIKEKAFKHEANIPEMKRGKVQSPKAKAPSASRPIYPGLYDSDVKISDLEPVKASTKCQDTMQALHRLDEMDEAEAEAAAASGSRDHAYSQSSECGSGDHAYSQSESSPAKKLKKSRAKKSSPRKAKSRGKASSGSASDLASPRSNKRTRKPKTKSAKSPKTKSATAKSPASNSPKAKSSKQTTLKVAAPKVKTPKSKSPKAKSPKAKTPRVVLAKKTRKPKLKPHSSEFYE